MASVAGDTGLRRDVRELAVAVVLEQDVALSDRGHEEIGIAVVVDVREGGADAGAVSDADARAVRDVLEAAAAQIAIEPVLADLIDEVQIQQAVAIDVRDGDARCRGRSGWPGSTCRCRRCCTCRKVMPLEPRRSVNLKVVRRRDGPVGGGLRRPPLRDPLRISRVRPARRRRSAAAPRPPSRAWRGDPCGPLR